MNHGRFVGPIIQTTIYKRIVILFTIYDFPRSYVQIDSVITDNFLLRCKNNWNYPNYLFNQCEVESNEIIAIMIICLITLNSFTLYIICYRYVI